MGLRRYTAPTAPGQVDMSKSIKQPMISPLLVSITVRALRAVAPKLTPTEDVWSNCPGLRLANPDPDRTDLNWTQGWPAPTRKTLAEAWGVPECPASLLGFSPDPAVLSDLIAQGSEHVRWGLGEETSPDAAGLSVQGWRLPRSPTSGWPMWLLDRWSLQRATATQVWLELPGTPDAWGWWDERALDDSLKWGASWWMAPPEAPLGDQAWDRYTRFLQDVGRRVLAQPRMNQWVWPWANLAQQAIEDTLRGASVTARSGPPFAWASQKGEEWGRLRKAVWEGMQASMGAPSLLEDVLAGICLEALKRKPLQPDGPPVLPLLPKKPVLLT